MHIYVHIFFTEHNNNEVASLFNDVVDLNCVCVMQNVCVLCVCVA